MADPDHTVMDLPTARGRMTRRATKLKKYIATLEATINDKSLDVIEIRWLRDICCTISSDRDTYNRLAEFVEDHEHDETQIGVDETAMDEYRSAVQEGLRLCSLCHSILVRKVGVLRRRLFPSGLCLAAMHISQVVWAWPSPLPTRLKRVGKNA